MTPEPISITEPPAQPARWAQVAAFTHPGLARPVNEDAVLVGAWWSQERLSQPWTGRMPLQEPLVCMVADGLGGHGGGDRASRLAVEILSRRQEGLGLGEAGIRAILADIHQRLLSESGGGGTTLAGLVLIENRAWAINVGDSRIYRFGDGFLTQLSTDDVPDPRYGSDERRASHRISQCLGLYLEAPVPHIRALDLSPGDVFLACSDGLTEMVDLDRLEAILGGNPGPDLGVAAASLAGAALEAGGLYNLSIILARIETGVAGG